MRNKILLVLCLMAVIALSGCGASMYAYTNDGADNLGLRAGLIADRFEFGADNLREKYDEGSGDWDPYFMIHAIPGGEVDPYVGVSSDKLKISNESDLEPFYGVKVGPTFVEYQDRNDNLFFGLAHTIKF